MIGTKSLNEFAASYIIKNPYNTIVNNIAGGSD